jgi:hypothetical protein
MKKILTIITLTLTLNLYCQELSISNIEQLVDEIDSDSTLTKLEFDRSELYNQTTDGKGTFTIWHLDNIIKKITQKAFLSYGALDTEVYLKDENPILIIDKELHYQFNSANTEIDYDKPLLKVFEDKIFCSDWDLDPIKVETIGNRQLTEKICGISDYSNLLDEAKKLLIE